MGTSIGLPSGAATLSRADASRRVREVVSGPLAELRCAWVDAFRDLIAESARASWGESAAGHILGTLGRLLTALEEVAQWELHERLAGLPTWFLLDLSPKLPPTDIVGALRSVVAYPRFLCRGLPAAAGLLIAAHDGEGPDQLRERLVVVEADSRTRSAFDWLVYFRDRLLPPPPRRRRDGRRVRSKPRPGGMLVADPRDLDAVERMLTGWRPVRVPAEPYLSECHITILVELLALGATEPGGKKQREVIARRLLGKTNTGDLDHEIAELKSMEYTDSRTGRRGGVWLTAAGKARATRLAAASRPVRPSS